MTISPKKLLFTVFLALLLSFTNLYSQSENEKIDNLIEQKRAFNKKNKNSIVYKIQLYNGNETDAYKIKLNFNAKYPEYTIKIIYKSPEWKTQVGNFNTRLEADRVLNIIKGKFSGAIVLEDKI
ncbi:MAG: SPOR domain-containing protein [Lutibacter sp.]|uniref:SPOR domain-containing protein n=1 Tax=Lutibacter sp. TaxID=1925666 RepID=UPI003859A2AA